MPWSNNFISTDLNQSEMALGVAGNLFLFWGVAVNLYFTQYFCCPKRAPSKHIHACRQNIYEWLLIARKRLSQQRSILLLLACQARSSKQTFLVHTAWKNVFWNILVVGLTKIGYLDHAIGFNSKKYPFTRILVTGHDQSSALSPHPRVTTTYLL